MAKKQGPRGTRGQAVEDAALGFAEDLGRLLGTTQKKAEEWLGQRKALAQRLTQIRDAANGYLHELTGAGETIVRRGRKPGRPAGAAGQTAVSSDTGGEVGGRKRKRRGMTAAQRKAVGERMKKYWAARKKANASK